MVNNKTEIHHPRLTSDVHIINKISVNNRDASQVQFKSKIL